MGLEIQGSIVAMRTCIGSPMMLSRVLAHTKLVLTIYCKVAEYEVVIVVFNVVVASKTLNEKAINRWGFSFNNNKTQITPEEVGWHFIAKKQLVEPCTNILNIKLQFNKNDQKDNFKVTLVLKQTLRFLESFTHTILMFS